MSNTKQVLELSSPSTRTRHERLTGLTQRCNYCQGNGWFWGYDAAKDSVKNPCPMCEGSGKLQPVITIDWKPVCRTEK